MPELAKFVIDFEGRLQKLEGSMKRAELLGKKASDRIEKDFQSINTDLKLRFDNAVAKLKINEVRKLKVKLENELERKIKLNVDTASIERTRTKLASVNNALRDVPPVATKAKLSIGKMVAQFAIAGGVFLAFRKAIRFGGEAKDLARDATEIESKFNQVFISLEDKANQMASSFAQSFGLATSSARQFLSATGDILVGFGFSEQSAFDMSMQVNELAQDLASFTNLQGGAKQASDALTKALVGETESAKSLGIVIRQDTKEFKDNVAQIMETQGVTLQQAKSIEILRIAYEQSGKAIGDFGRTQDELANQERILDENIKNVTETIGAGLTPIMSKATTVALDFFRSLTETSLDESIRRLGELGAEAEELTNELAFQVVVRGQEELEELDKIINDTSNGVFDFIERSERLGQKFDILKLFPSESDRIKFETKFKAMLEDLRNEDISIEVKIAKRDALRRDIISLRKQFIERQRLGIDTSGIEHLIDVRELELGAVQEVVKALKEQEEIQKRVANAEKIILGEEPDAVPERVVPKALAIESEFIKGILKDEEDRLKQIELINRAMTETNAKTGELVLGAQELKLLEQARNELTGEDQKIEDRLKAQGKERKFIEDIITADDKLKERLGLINEEYDRQALLLEATGLALENQKNIMVDMLALTNERNRLEKELADLQPPEFILPMNRPPIHQPSAEELEMFTPEEVKQSMDDAFEKAKGDTISINREMQNVGRSSQNIANILGAGAHTFINILITGMNEVVSIIGSALSIIASVASFISGGVGGLAVGAITKRAGGGNVNANEPYFVGESGTELFIPKTAGTIIPNNQLGDNKLLKDIRSGIDNLIESTVISQSKGQVVHTVLEVDGDVLAEKQYFNENRSGINTRNTGDFK